MCNENNSAELQFNLYKDAILLFLKTMWSERLCHWEHSVSGMPAVIPQRALTSFLLLHGFQR